MKNKVRDVLISIRALQSAVLNFQHETSAKIEFFLNKFEDIVVELVDILEDNKE